MSKGKILCIIPEGSKQALLAVDVLLFAFPDNLIVYKMKEDDLPEKHVENIKNLFPILSNSKITDNIHKIYIFGNKLVVKRLLAHIYTIIPHRPKSILLSMSYSIYSADDSCFFSHLLKRFVYFNTDAYVPRKNEIIHVGPNYKEDEETSYFFGIFVIQAAYTEDPSVNISMAQLVWNFLFGMTKIPDHFSVE